MALNIQIPYRGDAYLFSGISNAGTGIAQGIEQMSAQLKKAKAYRAMAVDALGMDKDQVDKMGLPELEGHFQAVAVKNAMEQQQALAQERQAKAAELMMRGEEANAMPEFAKALMAGRATPQDNPPSGPIMQPGGAPTPGPAPAPAPSGNFSPEEMMGAMQHMGKTNPRLAAAMARVMIPQLMQGGSSSMPQAWKSPEGNPYVFMHNTLTPDRPPVDMSAMMGAAPEGFQAVPTGPNRVQYLKTDKTIPPSFHSALDTAQSDIASASATLQQPDTAFKNADEAKTMKGYATRRLQSAQARGKATIDRYHLTGYLTDEQRDQMYEQLGLNKATNKAAPAGPSGQPPEERVPVVDAKGNKFTVPKSQLDQALKQGYTQAK